MIIQNKSLQQDIRKLKHDLNTSNGLFEMQDNALSNEKEVNAVLIKALKIYSKLSGYNFIAIEALSRAEELLK